MMNERELRAIIVREGKRIPDVAKAIGINKATLYKKLRGENDFTRSEIVKISNFLNLSPEQILFIFLDIEISQKA